MTAAQDMLKPVPNSEEFVFTDADFHKIATLAREEFGLNLQISKKALVYARLAKRLRILRLKSFDSYCQLLNGADSQNEKSHVISALTTNVTHFFREAHHFDFLQENILPSLIKRAQQGQRIRLWSAACSAGQEAYSMAAAIVAVCPTCSTLDLKILASDIDPKVIEEARTGTYAQEQLSAIPSLYQNIMVTPDASSPSVFSISEKLRALISFQELNLVGEWPMRQPFDVIFCRNVAIYFDKPTQQKLWARFANALRPNGHLMIGHSERLHGAAENYFCSVGITTYQKSDAKVGQHFPGDQ